MTERVGRYRIGDVIGVGSFATVHRAVDDALESTVVVKVLAENHSLNPEIRERFISEGRSLRRVDSPHVVVVHDIGESSRQQPYLVFAHADRGTLAQRVATLRGQGWTASRDDVLALARALAAALSAVHAAGLVHRDLSPSNVLLTSVPGLERGDAVDDGAPGLLRHDERLVLADLGLCKDLALNSGLTVAGGTSGFRPPEQRAAGTVDARADLWALSALLQWLTEGAQLPRRLQAVLARSLAGDPARRHPDAASWLADVERALEPEPVETSPPRRWGAVAMAAAAAVALLLGLLAGVLLVRAGEPPSSSGPASVTISGPDEVAVGETATFSADADGVTTWVWTLPTGAYVVDEEQVSVTPSGAGTARVVLTAIADDGTELRTEHVFTVTG